MTLYISDLDGTLLKPDATVSPESRQILNRLIGQGLHFTVATARTAATVKQILKNVRLQMPVVLMNGSCVYDLNTDTYVRTMPLSNNARTALFQAIREQSAEGFVYTVDNNQMTTFYERADRQESKDFILERTSRYRKKFVCVSAFEQDISTHSIVYYSTTGRRQDLEKMKETLERCQDITVALYRDVYDQEQCFLEVSAAEASKYSAVQFLKQRYGFDTVTCFGDNINDLPMFQASDRCYAVANALPEVLQQATGIIGRNTEDGVARWLHQHLVERPADNEMVQQL